MSNAAKTLIGLIVVIAIALAGWVGWMVISGGEEDKTADERVAEDMVPEDEFIPPQYEPRRAPDPNEGGAEKEIIPTLYLPEGAEESTIATTICGAAEMMGNAQDPENREALSGFIRELSGRVSAPSDPMLAGVKDSAESIQDDPTAVIAACREHGRG